MRSAPEGLTPLRWRWIRLRTRHDEIRFLYVPPCHPLDYRKVTMLDLNGCDVGVALWRVCDPCQLGYIDKISISPEFQSRGFGRRLIRRAVTDGPRYAWQTSGQSPEAQVFFPTLEREMGVLFPMHGPLCRHFKDQARALPAGHPSRSVLDRTV